MGNIENKEKKLSKTKIEEKETNKVPKKKKETPKKTSTAKEKSKTTTKKNNNTNTKKKAESQKKENVKRANKKVEPSQEETNKTVRKKTETTKKEPVKTKNKSTTQIVQKNKQTETIIEEKYISEHKLTNEEANNIIKTKKTEEEKIDLSITKQISHIKKELEDKEAKLKILEEIKEKKDKEKQEEPKEIQNIEKHQENKSITKKKKKRKLKKKVYVIILLLLIIIWVFSVYKIINWHLDNKEVEKQSEKAQDTTEVIESTNGEKVNPPENKFDPYWDFINIPLVSVDFEKLIKENNDTVGWIFVDSSNINYPVVQTNDNKFYLNHGFDKQYNDAGWVFMDYRNNSKTFEKNTIIYAHSRIDRSLFGTLRNATKQEWFDNKDNHIIKFSTPTENTMWMVFSSYTIEAEGYYLKTDFANDNEYQMWLDEMLKRSKFNYNTEVTTNDQILTLSSCYTADGIRVAVHAKLIKKEVR